MHPTAGESGAGRGPRGESVAVGGAPGRLSAWREYWEGTWWARQGGGVHAGG